MKEVPHHTAEAVLQTLEAAHLQEDTAEVHIHQEAARATAEEVLQADTEDNHQMT